MTAEQRAAFERDGYLIIRGALAPDEVAGARDAIDRVYAARAKAGSLGPDGSMHLLSAVASCPQVVGLIDHPATFGYVWSILGWNIHVYHSHLDVRPPLRVPLPFRFEWHQDGGRQCWPTAKRVLEESARSADLAPIPADRRSRIEPRIGVFCAAGHPAWLRMAPVAAHRPRRL
jgi:hypothetical protein